LLAVVVAPSTTTHSSCTRVWKQRPIELVGADEAQEINPFCDMSGVVGAIWTEGEGHVDPSGVAYLTENAAAPGTRPSVLIVGEQRMATALDGPVFDHENEHLLG
jgi:glycine/D-amino acid oxidase-like deaminating enzyme